MLTGGPGARIGIFGGARATVQPSTSAPNVSSVARAYGGVSGSAEESAGSALSPAHGFGIRFWLGVAGIVGLVLVYHSLPE
jgi:hypothetical protein